MHSPLRSLDLPTNPLHASTKLLHQHTSALRNQILRFNPLPHGNLFNVRSHNIALRATRLYVVEDTPVGDDRRRLDRDVGCPPCYLPVPKADAITPDRLRSLPFSGIRELVRPLRGVAALWEPL